MKTATGRPMSSTNSLYRLINGLTGSRDNSIYDFAVRAEPIRYVCPNVKIATTIPINDAMAAKPSLNHDFPAANKSAFKAQLNQSTIATTANVVKASGAWLERIRHQRSRKINALPLVENHPPNWSRACE